MVTVTYGANELKLDGAAFPTVGAIRAALATVGVNRDDQASINGENASDSDPLEDGDELAFVKQTAQKG